MSHLGSLSRCMMETDPESRTRAKWLRGKSLALSLAIEAAVAAALLLAPLLAPGVLPPAVIFTPATPFRGLPQMSPAPSRPSRRLAPARQHVIYTITAAPTGPRTRRQIGEAPPMIGDRVSPGGPGPGALGGGDRGAVINLAPPQVAAPAKPLAQSEGVMAARLVRRVQPDYPRIAQLMHLAGTVRLQAVIGTDGTVQQLEVLSGNPILVRAAVEAVRQWRYEPTRLDGQPVEVETSITVTFVLN